MRRVPILATLIVVAAVLTMVGLGLWQLQRARWKDGLLAEYAAAANMPAVDLDPLLDGRAALPPLSFRRALVTCNADDVLADIRAGRSAGDVPGQSYIVPCRPGAAGLAGRLRVNVGWSERPDGPRRLSLHGLVAGRLGEVREDGPVTLTAATAVAPLAASQPVTVDTIPNNHLSYAFQWFAFAAIALIIYGFALRRRQRRTLPPEP